MVSILQTDVIDVADWLDDELYPNYPEGARSKDAIFPPPDMPINFIKAQRRYLYKRSNRKYPDQFWGEIVAYLVGCLLEVQVPPAFAATNSAKDDCGALIEWFYEDGKATYIAGGHFMQRLMPDFDRKRGDQHNFHSIQVLSKSFNRAFAFPNWEQWWCEALLFDALIGNTDRHQDNWGCIFVRRRGRTMSATMAPLFDNGTSLGHERFPENLAAWTEENFQRYVAKGTHHVRWDKDDPLRCGHIDTFAKLKVAFPEQIDNLIRKIDNFNIDALMVQLDHLCRLPLRVSLTQERKSLYIRLRSTQTSHTRSIDMNQIEHIIDPNRLLLVWRAGVNAQSRTRRVVAEIVKGPDTNGLTLRYTKGTKDFEHARDEGFLGYPAFDLKQAEHTHNVLDSFIRRLPPRKRDDFTNYLSRHRLPLHESISDLALLAYTNAKLPSDGFELYPDLTNARPPFELVFEVAGFRHQDARSSEDMYIGDPIVLKSEPDNAHDNFAVAVYHSGAKIGYVDRAQSPAFAEWMRRGYSLNASVERINGKPERPLVYIYLTVR